MNPTVKRSGWTPPQDTGLWDLTDRLQTKMWSALPPNDLEYIQVEGHVMQYGLVHERYCICYGLRFKTYDPGGSAVQAEKGLL